MKFLFIVGSLRKESFNMQLAKLTAEYLKDKAEVEILDYKDVPFFNQDLEESVPQVVTDIRNKVLAADGLWIFSPEYNHYFPGVLKNLLDWLSRPVSAAQGQVLNGKPIALSGITPGMTGTMVAQDHLVGLLSFLNMRVMNSNRLTIPNAMQQLDENGRLSLTASEPFLHKQADSFVKFVQGKK